MGERPWPWTGPCRVSVLKSPCPTVDSPWWRHLTRRARRPAQASLAPTCPRRTGRPSPTPATIPASSAPWCWLMASARGQRPKTSTGTSSTRRRSRAASSQLWWQFFAALLVLVSLRVRRIPILLGSLVGQPGGDVAHRSHHSAHSAQDEAAGGLERHGPRHRPQQLRQFHLSVPRPCSDLPSAVPRRAMSCISCPIWPSSWAWVS